MSALCKNTDKAIMDACRKHKVEDRVFVSFRVTQVYETGACVYLYFGFNYQGVSNPLEIYDEVETIARNEMIRNGGSISHHHGIGKIRKKFLPTTLNETSQRLIRDMKKSLDPNNIFALNNTVNHHDA